MLSLSLAHWLVILSSVISMTGAYAYIRDTISGKTTPNRVSWSMWALAPLIGTGAAWSANADIWALVRIFLAGFVPLLVFLTSFANLHSYWKITSFDLLCGGLSLIALVFWGIADAPRTAIVLAAVGDGLASLPTVIKAWRYPETETGLTYTAGFISVLLVIPSIPVWNIENAAFQVHLLLVNALLSLAVYRKKLPSRTGNYVVSVRRP